MLDLLGLWLSALLAATLFPAQSEAVLVALLVQDAHPVWLLLVVATSGNVLGAVVNWALGRGLAGPAGRHWLRVPPATLARAESWYRRWGWWSLVLSWVPLIGDPLTLVAGLLRAPLPGFLLVVTLAKGGRYLVLSLATGALV